MSDARMGSSFCVFCGSSPGASPRYREAAAALGEAIAKDGARLVYGGASVGLMGAVASAALGAGGDVIGILPSVLMPREIAHPSLTELEVVDSMHERKARMVELSHAFIVLPGGGGTLDELFEVFTWAQLGLHAKPMVLFDVEDFFRPLLQFVDKAVEEGFISPLHRSFLRRGMSAEEVVRLAKTPLPKVPAVIGESDL